MVLPQKVDNYMGTDSYHKEGTASVAISNNRILSMQDGKVNFRWRDYADGNKMKTMTMGIRYRSTYFLFFSNAIYHLLRFSPDR